ncbi:MAG: hypothetical protein A2487_02185 [Candidatus Raymondbacteria bacterium RifOxyC12_full_50_8]|nr:MAG: hypothetical protein A2350_12510 [Candidatus Raymondbacteria bacterium RifOxyB12_full_50_8]OGK06386.1 MAG: hypothetical protein A2487_02185 [Candidatus Raymondbacteria bacterium RifOxyC12_full_50_8]
MHFNRFFLFWYILLALVLLLCLRFFAIRQWDQYSTITDNPHFQTLLQQQYDNAPDLNSKILAAEAVAQYRQIDFVNRLSIKKSRMLFDGLLLVLFLSMVVLFMVGMHIITLPLQRVLKYSSEIAKGNIKALPDTGSDRRGLGNLNKAFNLLVHDLKESQKHLAIAEKEKTWREIAQILAHEIKNPLTPIRLSVELMDETLRETNDKTSPRLRQSLGTIQEETGRLEMLVNNFRDFSKKPELVLATVDVEALINDVGSPFKDTLSLSVKIKGDNKIFSFDRLKMHQVFLNLFKNSIEAGATEVRVSINTENINKQISFADNGTGFTRDTAPMAFIPYQTTKKNGTGLGLSIVKNIIEAHQGTIEIVPDRNTGSELLFTFPPMKGEKHE